MKFVVRIFLSAMINKLCKNYCGWQAERNAKSVVHYIYKLTFDLNG